MMGFIASQRAEGYAVDSICRVLREQGCHVAARTYPSWKDTNRRSPSSLARYWLLAWPCWPTSTPRPTQPKPRCLIYCRPARSRP